MEQFRLAIQTAGPAASLAEVLVEIGEGVTVTEIDLYWDTGIGAQSQRIVEVATTLGAPWVPVALGAVEEWLAGTDLNDIVVEVSPIFSRRITRDG